MKTKKIIIASNNQGKVREIKNYFEPFNISISSQRELNIKSIPETGKSFLSNALLKANHLLSYAHHPVIADDSGLIVEALNGEPGINSARFAGEEATDEDNINLLIEKMQDKTNRTAHFHCSLVYVSENYINNPIIVESKWRGIISNKKVGNHGFGYDPVFFLPNFNKTAAELSSIEKNKISHRGQAMELLINKLQSNKLI